MPPPHGGLKGRAYVAMSALRWSSWIVGHRSPEVALASGQLYPGYGMARCRRAMEKPE